MTLFLNLAAGASTLVGLYALFGLLRRRTYINGATAALLAALAFGATAGGEFVREGVRKPFTIRRFLYSNAVTTSELPQLRRKGCVTEDPFPLARPETYPNDQVRLGRKVYRFQCSVCHTISGMNGLTHLAGTWAPDQMRMNIAKLQHTKPFMPPFAGNANELEALVQMLRWEVAGRPETWPLSTDEAARARILRWLEEAGTELPTRGGG
jgi:mono/diheme cytochrome c family protein